VRLPRLHLTTNDEVLRQPGFLGVARSVLRCCGTYCALHLRGHGMSGAELHELGEALAVAALRTGSWLIVNDRVDVAMAVRANGVQLGARSLEVADARALLGAGARIGVSTHGAAEVRQAELNGADFTVLGNIFETASHPGRAGLGAAEVTRALGSGELPVLGIGGITPARLGELATAGAYGAVVLGGVWHASDPVEAAAEYVAAVDAAWSES
jgi:thiamine-phosphate diphosphorylase